MQCFEPIFDHPVESQEDRQVEAFRLQLVNKLLQIDGSQPITFRMYHQVTVVGNGKVPAAPAINFVQIHSICRGPAFARCAAHCRVSTAKETGRVKTDPAREDHLRRGNQSSPLPRFISQINTGLATNTEL